MNSLNSLIDQYQAWNKAQGLNLGSADEHHDDPSLTVEQRAWLHDFSQRWDAAAQEEREHMSIDSQNTLKTVAGSLKDIGATFEYPGFISIMTRGGYALNFGDANGDFGYDIYGPDGSFESGDSLPLETGAKALAEWIRSIYGKLS